MTRDGWVRVPGWLERGCQSADVLFRIKQYDLGLCISEPSLLHEDIVVDPKVGQFFGVS